MKIMAVSKPAPDPPQDYVVLRVYTLLRNVMSLRYTPIHQEHRMFQYDEMLHVIIDEISVISIRTKPAGATLAIFFSS